MNCCLFAVTWLGKEHRVFGLDWSWLDLLGLVGQLLFSFRFITQWLESEKRGMSYIPVSFWYWSLAGSIILTIYWICKRSPIGIIANLPNSLIYFRNLQLIRRNKPPAAAVVADQIPVEENPAATGEPPGPEP